MKTLHKDFFYNQNIKAYKCQQLHDLLSLKFLNLYLLDNVFFFAIIILVCHCSHLITHLHILSHWIDKYFGFKDHLKLYKPLQKLLEEAAMGEFYEQYPNIPVNVLKSFLNHLDHKDLKDPFMATSPTRVFFLPLPLLWYNLLSTTWLLSLD